MTDSPIEEVVENAAENLAAAELAQANALAEEAQASTVTALAEATALTVASAEAATALSHEQAAAAQTEAANQINETKEAFSWLKQNADQTASLLNQQTERLNRTEEAVAGVSNLLKELQTALSSSIQPKSAEDQALNPEELKNPAGGDGQGNQEQPQGQPQNRRKKVWI